jgi:ankyrin repeat protein
MHLFKGQNIAIILLASLGLSNLTGAGPTPEPAIAITPDDFVRAVANHDSHIIDLYLSHQPNLNARATQDRPLLVSTILQRDVQTANRLIDAGACVDLRDEGGLTPLMAAALIGDEGLVNRILPLAGNPAATDLQGRTALHYAMAAGQSAVVEVLLPTVRDLGKPTKDGRTVMTMALQQDDPRLADLVLERLPAGREWRPETSQMLQTALSLGRKDQVKTLLSKHTNVPVPEGKRVPLLAYAMAWANIDMCRTLLDCGADPNTMLPEKCEPDFLALLSPRLRDYIDGDKGVTVLDLAAGLGQCDTLNALLDAGADRNRATLRF